MAPNGHGCDEFWKHSWQGKSGIRRISRFDPSSLRSQIAGEITNFDESNWISSEDQKDLSGVIAYADAAATEALEQAQFSHPPRPERVSIVLGSGGGAIDFMESQYRWYFTDQGEPSVYNIPSSTMGNLASELSIRKEFTGPSHVVSTGCNSSSDAFGHALMMLRAGRIDSVLCGGVDRPITPAVMAGFEKMRVTATGWNQEPTRASRPFDRRRNGFVLGEGAWFALLETESSWKNRNGPDPLARLSGYASSCDAHHRVRMNQQGKTASKTIEKATRDANKDTTDIDYIQAHGTSTKMNDRVETRIFKQTFDDPPPISSVKSMIGHPQGASGAAGLVAGIGAIQKQSIHPTINLEETDPDCDLFYVPNESMVHDVDTVLIHTLGFGSRNSCIILEKP